MKTTTLSSLLLSSLLLVSLGTGCGSRADGSDIAGNGVAVSGRPYFEVFKGADGRSYFHLLAANHENILASQAYDSRTAALGGMLSVLENGVVAARYELLRAKNGQYYFNLEAANGQVIGTSETYTSKSNANRGMRSVIDNVAKYLEYRAMNRGARFEIKTGADGRFYFNLRAQNGEIVLSSQGYSSEAAALNGTFSVVDNGITGEGFDVRQAQDGGYYFNLLATNGQVIATSEVYVSKFNAERARDAVVDLLAQVELL